MASSALKSQIKSHIPSSCKSTKGIPSNLHVAEDLRYELTSNIDTADGLVNGATGILKKN